MYLRLARATFLRSLLSGMRIPAGLVTRDWANLGNWAADKASCSLSIYVCAALGKSAGDRSDGGATVCKKTQARCKCKPNASELARITWLEKMVES